MQTSQRTHGQSSLKELLNEDNFGFQRDIQGEEWAAAAWTQCLENEYYTKMDSDTFFSCAPRIRQSLLVSASSRSSRKCHRTQRSAWSVGGWIHSDAPAYGGFDEVHTFSTCRWTLDPCSVSVLPGNSGGRLQEHVYTQRGWSTVDTRCCVSLGGCANEFPTFSYVEMDL